ncbi:MAG: TrmH family RNA methyltransferase, partial [Simkaniaceae bacterium]|nr:TrmH family RNA methyltransferase [Simkaniaceae bacterium]
LRFPPLYPCPKTPSPENPKVAKTSMGTAPFVPYQTITDLSTLPRPWIALETTKAAIPYNTYKLPSTATFFFGNEEYGLSKQTLEKTDLTLEIPLYGGKNSLNVANAFAILAAHIRIASE